MKTDILIVGSGPAGCAAAITARQGGLNVVLLEARANERRAPGETLHPGIEPILDKLGLRQRVCDEGFHRHRGIWVTWNAPRHFQPYGADPNGSWFGFQVDRAKFGALLVDAARAAGATIFRSCRATRILRSGGRVIGVGTQEKELLARWVIDAGGGEHWLARQLGSKLAFYSPTLNVRFGWRKRTERDPDDPSFSACPRGWIWEAAVDEKRLAWVRLHFPCDGNERHRVAAIKGPCLGSTLKACNVTWRLVSECAGPGYFLLGDAAAVLDPASSHGVLRAMMSGMKAGYAILRVSGGFPENTAIRDYKKWTSDWFKHDAFILRSLYREHPVPPTWAADVTLGPDAPESDFPRHAFGMAIQPSPRAAELI